MRKKLGFLFFEEIHHIHHFIGIVSELKKMDLFDLSIITYKGKHEYLYYLMDLLNIPKDIVKQVPTKLRRRIIEKVSNRKMPSSKYLYAKNKNYLLTNFDALVFTDINQEYLFDRRKNKKPIFIYVGHGPAASKSYPYKFKEITKFDLILNHGPKCIDYHFKYFDYQNTEFKQVGYQKIDVARIEQKNKKFFNNNNLTVLYNPHFKKEYSSWYKNGIDILDIFCKNKQYNLIFAPHINLFNKKGFENKKTFPIKYLDCENILVDFGSENSVNMSYTLYSDLYLGDSSSQVYEFLLKPRPCIFINSHNIEWGNDELHHNWNLGKVINRIDDLESLLSTHESWQKNFLDIQIKELKYTNDIKDSITSSKRAAIAIKEKIYK
jgi:hypothetical protein